MKKLLKWVRRYGLDRGTNMHFRKGNNGKKNCYITTSTYEYCITTSTKTPKGYLGCVASCRTTEVGEKHLRGCDLPDGTYSKKTFIAIMLKIVNLEARGKPPISGKEEANAED